MEAQKAAAEFEQHRAHLTGVAYRMLGTLADAEDAVQETYLRFARTSATDLRDVRDAADALPELAANVGVTRIS